MQQDITRALQMRLTAKCFTRKLISHELCITNPVNCKQKLMGEMMKRLKKALEKLIS